MKDTNDQNRQEKTYRTENSPIPGEETQCIVYNLATKKIPSLDGFTGNAIRK